MALLGDWGSNETAIEKFIHTNWKLAAQKASVQVRANKPRKSSSLCLANRNVREEIIISPKEEENLSMFGEEDGEGIGEGEEIWLWLSEEANVINRGSRRECRCPTFMAVEETQVEVSKIKGHMSFVTPLLKQPPLRSQMLKACPYHPTWPFLRVALGCNHTFIWNILSGLQWWRNMPSDSSPTAWSDFLSLTAGSCS